jgi:hypothetical protein
MSSWKKTGGINNSSKFNTVRVQNSVSGSSSFIRDLGEKNTTTNVLSNLRFKEEAIIHSTQSNLADTRGLVAFYKFTDIIYNDIDDFHHIENAASYDYGNEYTTFDHSILNMKIVDSTATGKDLIVIGEESGKIKVTDIPVPDSLLTEKSSFLHFNQFIRFEGKTPVNTQAIALEFTTTPCKSLKSVNEVDFNKYHVTDRISNGETTDTDMSTVSGKYTHHNALTIMSWIRINKYDASYSNSSQPEGFMLFSLDDDVHGTPTPGQERLCFWAPGHKNNGCPQVHFGGRAEKDNGNGSNASSASTDINVQTDVSIPYNKWTLVSLVIDGNRAYIYQEVDGIHTLTQEIHIGDFRIPEKNIIVNGARFYNLDILSTTPAPGWVATTTQTSTMSVDIADFKVYNYPVDPHTIKRIYEHDNLFFKERVNFRIDPEYVKLGDDLIVGNDVNVHHDLVVSNDLRTFGVVEAYNNAFVAGSLGVGISTPDSNYRLNVLGDVRTSGDLHIGNSIFFKGVGANGETPSTTRIVERTKGSDYSELLISKGTDVGTETSAAEDSDSIRLRAPNVFINTFDGTNGTTWDADTSQFVFSKNGRLGVGRTDPGAEIDVIGTVRVANTVDSNSIFITNTGTVGARNVGVGAGSSAALTSSGIQNVSIGANSSAALTSGKDNTALGDSALKTNTTGSENVAVGSGALVDVTTGSENVAVGKDSGASLTSGSNNIFIGHLADVDADIVGSKTITGSMAIGPGAKIGLSDSANIGNKDGNLHVGINNPDPDPAYSLDIIGSLNISENLRINGVEFKIDTSGGDGKNQLVFASGVKSAGPTVFTDKTAFANEEVWNNVIVTDVKYPYDFQVENRNMFFKNYPPTGEQGGSVWLGENASNTFMTAYENSTVPDMAIKFDGNIVFDDSYNSGRTSDQGFTVKTMDAKFENQVLVEKNLIVQDPSKSNLAPALTIDPNGVTEVIAGNGQVTTSAADPSMVCNVDTTFNNNVTFGATDLDGNNNKVIFEATNTNKNVVFDLNGTGGVTFGSACPVNVTNLTITGAVTQNSSSAITGDQSVTGTFTLIDPKHNQTLPGGVVTNPDYDITNIGLDVTTNARITGDLTVTGNFNFEKAVLKNVIQEDHQTIRMSERVIIFNEDTTGDPGTTTDAPALHVTQKGSNHNIAEFYDGDLSGNSDQGLVFRIANDGVTDMYGSLGINKVPSDGFKLDVSGNTRVGGVSKFIGNVSIDAAGSDPLCSLDVVATDAIRIPVGTTGARASLNKEGMMRYNTDTSHLEYYGIGTAGDTTVTDADGWQSVAAGGRISSTYNTYINDQFMVEKTTGNVRIGTGRVAADARLHIDGGSDDDALNTSTDIIKIRRGTIETNKTTIASRKLADGEAIDVKTNTTALSDHPSLTIHPNGNIGMGTDTPTVKLDISSGVNDCAMKMTAGTGQNSTITLGNLVTANGTTTNSAHVDYKYDVSGNKLNFYHTSTTNHRAMTLLQSGNLGLNTTSPSALLHVNETSSVHDTKEVMRLTNNTTDDPATTITHLANFNVGKHNGNDDTSMLEIGVSSNPNIINTIMRLRSDGKVGINVGDAYMDTASALHVGGGNIVLGSSESNDQNRSLKMVGSNQTTTLKHDGLFKVEVTPTVGASKTPLTIGSNTVALDVSGGSFTINNKLSMTTTAATATISTEGNGVDLKLVGKSANNSVEIKDASGVIVGLDSDKKFYVGENIEMDLSGKIDMNGDLIIGSINDVAGNLECDGTGTFGGVAVIDGSTDASFGYTGKTPAIQQTSAGATTVSGQSISFDIGTANKANIDSTGIFTIANASVTKGTAQFDNGGLFVSTGTGQNLVVSNAVVIDTGTGTSNTDKSMLYDASKNSFGVLTDHVYVTGKQFHVSGHNGTGPRGMVVDPTDTDQDVVTIEGNLRVNGNITSAQSSSALSTASVTSALEGTGYDRTVPTSPNVLIGSNNQDNNVDNTYLVINGSATNNSIYAHGPIVSAEYFAAASDLNLKENISTINSALDKTNRLRGVYFTKKADVTGRREVGVIAQEVEKVFPEVVMGGEGKKTVAYANLCGVLIEAVKELSRENVSQAAEIKSLRNNIDTIRGDIDKLWEHKRTDDKGMVDQLTELKRELAAITPLKI